MGATPQGGTPDSPKRGGGPPPRPPAPPAPSPPRAGGPPGRPSMPPRPVAGPTRPPAPPPGATPSVARIFKGTDQGFALTNRGNQEPYAPGRDSIPPGQISWYTAPIGALGPLEDEPNPHPYAQAVGQAHQVASQTQEAAHTEIIAQASKKRRS